MRRIVAKLWGAQENQEFASKFVDAREDASAMFSVAVFCVFAVPITLPDQSQSIQAGIPKREVDASRVGRGREFPRWIQ